MSYDPESAHYFGLPNRPATPMKTIMNGTYGNVAEFGMLSRNQKIMQEQKQMRTLTNPRSPTKAMLMAHMSIR